MMSMRRLDSKSLLIGAVLVFGLVISFLQLSAQEGVSRVMPIGQNANRPSATPKPSPKSSSTPKPPLTSEAVFWNRIKNSNDPEEFRAFLRRFPKGRFAVNARNRINALEIANEKRAVEKLVDDWFAVVDRGDFASFLQMTDNPFLLIDKILPVAEVRTLFERDFNKPSHKPGHSFEDDPIISKKTERISDFKDEDFQLPVNSPDFHHFIVQAHHQNLHTLNLSRDDFVVFMVLKRGHPAVMLLYIRKVEGKNKVAGYWRD
jgi:hypothetical protein